MDIRTHATTVKLLLSPSEAAEMLSISRSLLYRLIMHKCIFCVKVGGSRRIPVRAIHEYVDELCGRAEGAGRGQAGE